MTNASRYLAIALLASGCGARHITGGSDSAPPDLRSVHTTASPAAITAGDEVSVWCAIEKDGAPAPSERSTVAASPPAFAATADGTNGWRVRLRTAGLVTVYCMTADQMVQDPVGAVVTVRPAPYVGSVDTTLALNPAGAGLPVDVGCAIYDVFGNLASDLRPTGIDADPALLVDPPSGAGFVVRGTHVGTYPIACRVDQIIDTTPALVTIIEGIPGKSDTSVDLTTITPGQEVTATCSVSDAFGNPLTGVPTTIAVLAADGATAADSGLVMTDSTFAATRSGTYYVFCRVPGYAAGDESPAVVTVTWGLPCTWAVDLATQDCYWRGRRLPLDALVYDVWGNRVEDAGFTLVATPDQGIVPAPQGGWVFTEEGDFDLAISVTGPTDPSCAAAPGSAAVPYLTNLRVDSTGPVLGVTSPARAAMLPTGPNTDLDIGIAGSATDAVSAIVDLTLNGAGLPVSGANLTEPVVGTASSRWGLTIITGSATDACGNRSVLAQSFLRSGAYFNASLAPDPGARAAQGILAQLNQSVLDDGNRSTLNDIASIGETIIRTTDWNGLIPADPPLASNDTSGRRCSAGCCFWCDTWVDADYELRRDANRSIYIEGPYITSLTAVDGGLAFDVLIGQADFPLTLWARDRECTCGIGPTTIASFSTTGTAGADWVRATGALQVSLSGGVPRAAVASMSLSTGGLYVSIGCASWLQWACDGFTDLLISVFEPTIEDALAGAISDQIPPLVEGMLGGFAIESGLEIPPPMSMHLELASGLDRVVFCGPSAGIAKPAECPATSPDPGYGQLGLYSQLYPGARGAGIPSDALGAIRKDGALPAFSASAYSFGMGLKDDLLNQVLWALWYGGGLDLDAADLAPLVSGTGVPGISMSLRALLPPVAMPGRNGAQLELGVGDMMIDATVDLAALLGTASSGPPLHVGLYLSAILGGSLLIDQSTNVLQTQFNLQPTVAVQVYAIDDPAYQGTMSDLFTGLMQLLLPSILGGVMASFPIPEINLGNIANLPTGTDAVWTLTGAQIDRASDYYRITGSLQ